MICRANQLTGFYMIGTLAVKGLTFRELLTRNRLAHSIDIALGLENYNTIHFIKEMDTGKQ